MISEQFMQLGRWDLRLSPDTPLSIRQLVHEGDDIIITPTRVLVSDYPGYDFTTIAAGYLDAAEQVLASARYRGPILEVSQDKTALSGHGMLWYLGNADGNGPWTRTATGSPPSWSVTPRTWAQHLNFVDGPPDYSYLTNGGWNGLTKASGVSLPSGTYPDASTTVDELPRNVLQRLLALASFLDVEFYVDPEGKFRHGGLGALFNTTPQVILMRGHDGRDLDLIGLRLVELYNTRDRWKATSGSYAVATTGGGWAGASVQRGINHGADGASYFYDVQEEVSDLADTAPRAEKLADEYAVTSSVVTASVDTYDPGRWMRPGDYLWVFDPINEIYDGNQATTYHGMHVTPAKLRLHGMDWPVRQGMGVYRLVEDHGPPGGYGKHPALLDLTDYVEFEDSDCRLDLGAWRRSYDQ